MNNDTELLLEEYRVVSRLKEAEYKARDLSTAALMTTGAGFLAYSLGPGFPYPEIHIFPMLVFIFLYINFVYRSILALKMDAYIRNSIESKVVELNYFTEKVNYGIGGIRIVMRMMTTILFSSAVLVSLSQIYIHNSINFFGFCAVLCFVTLLVAGYSYHFHSDQVFLDKWKRKELMRSNQVRAGI